MAFGSIELDLGESPAGYVGQLFTYTLPLMLLALPWSLLALPVWIWSKVETAALTLHAGQRWYLIPAAELASFVFWIGGFFGNTIAWRGHDYGWPDRDPGAEARRPHPHRLGDRAQARGAHGLA